MSDRRVNFDDLGAWLIKGNAEFAALREHLPAPPGGGHGPPPPG
ncbi:hypothetical protein ABZV78_07900 [Micromonospora sp. NPDC004540]